MGVSFFFTVNSLVENPNFHCLLMVRISVILLLING